MFRIYENGKLWGICRLWSLWDTTLQCCTEDHVCYAFRWFSGVSELEREWKEWVIFLIIFLSFVTLNVNYFLRFEKETAELFSGTLYCVGRFLLQTNGAWVLVYSHSVKTEHLTRVHILLALTALKWKHCLPYPRHSCQTFPENPSQLFQLPQKS